MLDHQSRIATIKVVVQGYLRRKEITTMFTLYQPDCGIYGIGETIEAARADAVEWLEGGVHEADRAILPGIDESESGDKLYIRECTDRLAAAIREESGTIVFEVNDKGLLDLVEVID
jgi:hypothetical protein